MKDLGKVGKKLEKVFKSFFKFPNFLANSVKFCLTKKQKHKFLLLLLDYISALI